MAGGIIGKTILNGLGFDPIKWLSKKVAKDPHISKDGFSIGNDKSFNEYVLDSRSGTEAKEAAAPRKLVDGQIDPNTGKATSGDFAGSNTKTQLTPEQIAKNNKQADVKINQGWAKRYNILLEDGNLFTGTQREIAGRVLGEGATPEQIYKKTPQISSILKGVRGNKEARAHAAEQNLLPENERTYPISFFNRPTPGNEPKKLFTVRMEDGTDVGMTKAEIVKEYKISLGKVERRFNGTVGTDEARSLATKEGVVLESSFQDGRLAGINKRTVDPLERLKGHVRDKETGKFTKSPKK